jgi:signal peptidase I
MRQKRGKSEGERGRMGQERGKAGTEGKKSVIGETVSFILYIAVVFLVTFLVIHYVGQRTQVSGSSMEYTLSDGDNLIVDKISYRFYEPERFDIIVFPFRQEEDTYYIKRIIGLPGETVQIGEDGTILINGMELEESYGREVIQEPGAAAEPLTLREGEYFVLGDNRNASSDSRDPSVGMIQREDIVGRAWLRIYPFDKVGFIRHQ